MQITKRTGEVINFAWDAPVNPALIDVFSLESSDSGATGSFTPVQQVFSSVTTINRGVEGHKFYRLASVKGPLRSYAAQQVEVLIDDTPPPPENFRAT